MGASMHTAARLCFEIDIISQFLIRDLAPEQARTELIAKSCVLAGEHDDELELIREAHKVKQISSKHGSELHTW